MTPPATAIAGPCRNWTWRPEFTGRDNAVASDGRFLYDRGPRGKPARMSDTDRYRPQPRRKKAPGKRVTMSDEAKRAYEDTMRQRDERERTYGRHLAESDKKAR
jgi:hypothetical protein